MNENPNMPTDRTGKKAANTDKYYKRSNLLIFGLIFTAIIVFVLIYLLVPGKQKNIKRVYENVKVKEKTFPYGIKMVFVEGGEFTMGLPSGQGYGREHPQHKVWIDSFWIEKYEVNQKLWKEIMENNPSYFKGDALPVEGVSWNDVQEFVKRLAQKTGLNFRLPTEAEWEYAARGGKYSRGYNYSGSNNSDEIGWYVKNSKNKTHPVGLKNPNELKLYDMSGNVWEWVQDRYDEYYYSKSPYKNPKGPLSSSRCVVRGGGWNYPAWFLSPSSRYSWNPSDGNYIIGFRLALTQ